MKLKRQVLSGIFAIALLLSACSNKTNEKNVPATNPTDTPAISNGNDGNNPVVDHNLGVNGQMISVSDIKEKYEETVDSVMPLYNVRPDEAFEFHFNVPYMELENAEHITVHTDPRCLEESKIYVYEIQDERTDGTNITISPIGGVLLNDSEEYDNVYNEQNVWGNAAVYYLCIRYDTETTVDTKLAQPIIIPFTIRHEIPAPFVKGLVDSEGVYSLEWEPVEGASEYRVYNLVGEDSIFGANSAINGAEKGYNDCSLLQTATTTECRFEGFSGGDSNRVLFDRNNDNRIYVIGQNFSVYGEYGVTAVVDGKEGPLGVLVSTCDLKLPRKVVDEDDIMFSTISDESELPLTVRVENIDGSVTSRKVMYTYQTHTTYLGTQAPEYGYQVEGTAITGCVGLDSEDPNKVWPETINEFTPIGNVEPENNIPPLPDINIQTIIPVQPDNNQTTATPDPDPNTAPVPDPLYDQIIDNTNSHIENGKNETVKVSDMDLLLFSDSAAEEWMALNMASGVESFSIEAFPEIQISNNLFDVFEKVTFQNPYIIGVKSISYDYSTFTVTIKYCYDQETIAEKQKAVLEEAERICQQVVTSDMSAEAKQKALYDYLEKNCQYDNGALENAEKNNFTNVDTEFEDAFNAYGIIVKKVGVCQSYALSYKLLCQMSGIECRVITGYLNGNLPHGWNVVKIDNQWYQVDTTNNGATTGIPYFLYNCDSVLANLTSYSTNEQYELDSNLTAYTTEDDTHEYYYVQHLFCKDMDSFREVLDASLSETQNQYFYRYENNDFDEEEFSKVVYEVFNMHGLEDKLNSLRYLVSDGYICILLGE